MLFRRNDKGKTSFAFMLRTQAKAFDEGMFSTCSRQALLIGPAVCLKNILLIAHFPRLSKVIRCFNGFSWEPFWRKRSVFSMGFVRSLLYY